MNGCYVPGESEEEESKCVYLGYSDDIPTMLACKKECGDNEIRCVACRKLVSKEDFWFFKGFCSTCSAYSRDKADIGFVAYIHGDDVFCSTKEIITDPNKQIEES